MYTKLRRSGNPVNDAILKRGKELVKTVWEKSSPKIVLKSTARSITILFNADHVRLASSKHARSLASEGEFL